MLRCICMPVCSVTSKRLDLRTSFVRRLIFSISMSRPNIKVMRSGTRSEAHKVRGVVFCILEGNLSMIVCTVFTVHKAERFSAIVNNLVYFLTVRSRNQRVWAHSPITWLWLHGPVDEKVNTTDQSRTTSDVKQRTVQLALDHKTTSGQVT